MRMFISRASAERDKRRQDVRRKIVRMKPRNFGQLVEYNYTTKEMLTEVSCA
jgi:hypothetical protein